jgi:hypothetical protein
MFWTNALNKPDCDSHSFIPHSNNQKIIMLLLTMITVISLLLAAPSTRAEGTDFDFFSDEPIAEETLIIVPPPKPKWMTVGGPVALIAFFFFACFSVQRFVPFKQTDINFNLHSLPTAAQRGIGMAVILYGIALFFGGFEAHYQIGLHGSAELYFQQMGIGKLIAFTHAHLFGFTTSFFIIGIPFSLHFSRLKVYQWIFPVGLIASLTDIISWWGMKFISDNFEYITWFCGVIFSVCYIWMLIGLIRVIFFPNIKWFPDFISEDRQRRMDENIKDRTK